MFRSPVALVALNLGCITTSPMEPVTDEPATAALVAPYRTTLDETPCAGEDATTAEARRSIARIRAMAGLKPLVCDAAASAAARGHCGYVVANGVLTHVQVPGRPGFTGVTFADRLRAAGFRLDGGGEVIATVSGATAITGASGFMNSVYHRAMFLRSETTVFGYGAYGGCATIDFGRPLDAAKMPIERVVWPPDGATGVATTFHASRETPNPVPGSVDVGTPISVIGVGANANVAIAMGVPGTLITHQSDPNHLVRPGEAHFVPARPLGAHKQYTVAVTIDGETGYTTFTTE
jgi:uncharacterized protein YkwD